jgi:hypothetical protein
MAKDDKKKVKTRASTKYATSSDEASSSDDEDGLLTLLGVCFVAEDPKEGEHLRKIFSWASTEAVTYRASAQ